MAAEIGPLFQAAPKRCYGRAASAADEGCLQCKHLDGTAVEGGGCAALTLQRAEAGHGPSSDWLPDGFAYMGQVVRGEAAEKPAPPPADLTPNLPGGAGPVPAGAGVVQTELAELADRLRGMRVRADASRVRTTVELIYTAGPLLARAQELLDAAEFGVWSQGACGFTENEVRCVLKAYRHLPEATYRASLERMPSVEVLRRLTYTASPGEWLQRTHYVPSAGRDLTAYEMTATHIEEALALEKEETRKGKVYRPNADGKGGRWVQAPPPGPPSQQGQRPPTADAGKRGKGRRRVEATVEEAAPAGAKPVGAPESPVANPGPAPAGGVGEPPKTGGRPLTGAEVLMTAGTAEFFLKSWLAMRDRLPRLEPLTAHQRHRLRGFLEGFDTVRGDLADILAKSEAVEGPGKA